VVGLAQLVVTAVESMTGRAAPVWAQKMSHQIFEVFTEILDHLRRIERKVTRDMALDSAVLNRLLVGAKFLADREKAHQDTEAALTSERDQYKAAAEKAGADLSSFQAEEATEDAADEAGNTAAAQVADEIDALVAGDQTPTVEHPTDPADVVDVVSGNTDPVVTDPGPISDGTVTGDGTTGDAGSGTDSVGTSLES
jgi:hypothetical protein